MFCRVISFIFRFLLSMFILLIFRHLLSTFILVIFYIFHLVSLVWIGFYILE